MDAVTTGHLLLARSSDAIDARTGQIDTDVEGMSTAIRLPGELSVTFDREVEDLEAPLPGFPSTRRPAPLP